MEQKPASQSGPYLRTGRRQYRSCDQCRKARRACNVVFSEDYCPTDGLPQSPCSYCARRGKQCTISWLISVRNWSRSNIKKPARSHVPGRRQSSVKENEQLPICRQREISPRASPFTKNYSTTTTIADAKNPLAENEDDLNLGDDKREWLAEFAVDSFDENTASTTEDTFSHGDDFRASFSSQSSSISTVASLKSPDVIIQRMATTASRSFIGNSLIKIYHDSLENALSCWLTEKNCPYVGEALTKNSREPIQEVWGPNWSNRILKRVCKLDRAFEKFQSRPLTKAEDHTISNALRLAIMAFSSQWVQTGKRLRMESPKFFPNSYSQSKVGDEWAPSDFEQCMQEAFWNQARAALNETSYLDSFRLVFANIIFSLTQGCANARKAKQAASTTKTSLVQELSLIFEQEKYPLSFLKKATKQLSDMRWAIEKIQRDTHSSLREAGYDSAMGPVSDPLLPEDRQTVNFLFWLAIMFDTLSSAILEQPVTVSDEDSDITPCDMSFDRNQRNADAPVTSREVRLWGKHFIKPKQGIIWPWSYDDAASVLSDAAPVKVLLYRKISMLQRVLARRESSDVIERSIYNALDIYRHWSNNFGQFFLECTKHHDDLLPRLQSWYVVLAGHYNLAVLILADEIEGVDNSGFGNEYHASIRRKTKLVENLRRQKIEELAEVARCSIPRHNSQFERSSDFHYSINKGAMLSEPWTVILVRAFAKSAQVALDFMADANSVEVKILREQCQDCLEALWHLGKKSETSVLAFGAILKGFHDITGSYGRFDEQACTVEATTSSSYNRQHWEDNFFQSYGSIGAIPSDETMEPFVDNFDNRRDKTNIERM